MFIIFTCLNGVYIEDVPKGEILSLCGDPSYGEPFIEHTRKMIAVFVEREVAEAYVKLINAHIW